MTIGEPQSPDAGTLAALAALGRDLAADAPPDAMGARCLDLLADVTPADRALIGIMDGGVIQTVARCGVRPAGSDEPTLLQRAATEPAVLGREAAALDAGATGWIGMPILSGASLLGAISLTTTRDGGFAPADVAVTSAVSALAGVALRNRQLLLALSQGKREWEQTVDAISDGICVLDDHGLIRRANRAFCSLADIAVTEVAGRALVTLIPPTWAETFQQVIRDPTSSAAVPLRAGGRRFQVTALPLEEAGQASVVLVVADQTETQRLQDQLIQSEKMSAIGQLIAGIAHDLNNPLASVVGFADYLLETGADAPPELREPLRAIQQEAERAANIVRNLLNFARKQERQRRDTPVRAILETTLPLLRNQLMAAKIDIEFDVAPGVPPVLVDVNQIQQVFINLISNAAQAIQASGVGSRIVIRAVGWLDGVAITVEDDGPGIPAEIAPRIFEPFFTTKPTGEGTGLGLSICQGLVKEHGGRLSLVTTGRRGAVFQVELPAGTAPAPNQPRGAAPTLRPLRVLLVDDEPHIQHYMRATLEAWGHEVTVAPNGRLGLQQALAEPFDVIISDLRMPELGGREMFEQLRAQRPDAAERVVFSTGDTVRGDTLTFLESLQRPYLRKPFTLVELRAALADAVRRKA